MALALAVAIAVAGCAGLQSPNPAGRDTSRSATADFRISRILIDEGLKKLRAHQYEEASRIFNVGLKFSPDNVELHFFNGLTYHLLYLRGDEAAHDLAVTGYETALAIEPAYYQAALQLGRLEYETRRYGPALEAFQRAADIDPQSGEAYLGVAAAAYYAHDLSRARAAIEKATPLMKSSAAAAQAQALVYASLGDFEGAGRAVARFESIEKDGAARTRVRQRVGQWRTWHASLSTKVTGNDAVPADPALLAQAAPSLPTPPVPYTPGFPPQPTAAKEPALPRWTDCDTAATSSSPYSATTASSGYGEPTTADETTALPALPVPCKGAGVPHMAVLDVAIIRTEDTASRSHGVNLLNGLTYVLSRARQVTDTITRTGGGGETRAITITRQRSDSLSSPNSTSGIAYSLNIANATDSRSEVLAQPSLLALDRQSSTFFSGRNITLGIAGQAGGASTFTDRPVGVSLSVTPTFVDDETMLVSVRAVRSFFEEVDESVVFGQTMQTSRNAVSANVVLKFGQTLILSGLAEQEVQRATDGVPVLQDIPVLQYLFRNRVTQTFRRSVLVLITPRKPLVEREELARELAARTPGSDGQTEALVAKLKATLKEGKGLAPSLAQAYRHALDNKLFLQFRAGDIKADNWSTPERLDRLLRQLGDTLYF